MKRTGLTSTRSFQIGFILLLLICVGQITWWILDEVAYTDGVRVQRLEVFENERQVAEAWLAAGESSDEVEKHFPHLLVHRDGSVSINPEAKLKLDNEVHRRINRYGWEGTFFLLVLAAGMVVLSRTLVQQARLRQSQENFLAAIGHELKSPLAGLRLTSETLTLRETDSEERKRLVQRLLADVDRLEDMILNILAARQVDEEAPRHSRPLQLVKWVQLAREEVQSMLDATHTQVAIEVPDALWIKADPAGLRTVLRNLLDNAAKAIGVARPPDGGRIEVVGRTLGDRVELSIRDNGCGFPPREASRLFRKFYRIGDELTRDRPGVGLGLYLVARTVEADGGEVKSHSEGEGHGAQFAVTWLAAEATDE